MKLGVVTVARPPAGRRFRAPSRPRPTRAAAVQRATPLVAQARAAPAESSKKAQKKAPGESRENSSNRNARHREVESI